MTPADGHRLDQLVVGASLDGLAAARHAMRQGRSVRVVDERPTPGGTIRTLRSEGFSCELGPFALPAARWSQLTQALDHAPPSQQLLAAARTGAVWDGRQLFPVAIPDEPTSGPGGLEDLVQAFRRELGPCLWLSRTVEDLKPAAEGWTATLAGESPTPVHAREVLLCCGIDRAARLCAPFDPALPAVAERLQHTALATCHLGYWSSERTAAAFGGYGIYVPPDLPETATAPVAAREVTFCTNAFPRRAQAGKTLVRVELEDDAAVGTDEEILQRAVASLRTLTGFDQAPLFARVQRSTTRVEDAAATECRVRLQGLQALMPGLHWIG